MQSGIQAAQRVANEFGRVFGVGGQNEELTRQATQNLEAITETGSVLMRGFQDVSREWLDLMQERLRKNTEGMTKLAQCRTVPDLAAVQSDLARDNLNQIIDGTPRIAERSMKVADEAAKTITAETGKGRYPRPPDHASTIRSSRAFKHPNGAALRIAPLFGPALSDHVRAGPFSLQAGGGGAGAGRPRGRCFVRCPSYHRCEPRTPRSWFFRPSTFAPPSLSRLPYPPTRRRQKRRCSRRCSRVSARSRSSRTAESAARSAGTVAASAWARASSRHATSRS